MQGPALWAVHDLPTNTTHSCLQCTKHLSLDSVTFAAGGSSWTAITEHPENQKTQNMKVCGAI